MQLVCRARGHACGGQDLLTDPFFSGPRGPTHTSHTDTHTLITMCVSALCVCATWSLTCAELMLSKIRRTPIETTFRHSLLIHEIGSTPSAGGGAATTPPSAATCSPTTSVRAAAHAATPLASLRLCSASSVPASCVTSASIFPHRTPRACEQVRSIWLELALCSAPNGTAGAAAERPRIGSSDTEDDPGPPWSCLDWPPLR